MVLVDGEPSKTQFLSMVAMKPLYVGWYMVIARHSLLRVHHQMVILALGGSP